MTTSLTVEAVDQHGRLLSLPADAVTHSSSDSAVATVDSRGIITAISAGTAVISTTLTLNGVTATGSVVLQVVGIRRGKYELSAPVTASGWGVSGIFTAALRVSTDFYLDSNDIIGTFENLRLIGPDGSIEQSIPYGVVKIRLDGLSRLQLTLVAGNITYWEGMPSSADEDGFRGSYAIGDGFASGPFVGKRVGE